MSLDNKPAVATDHGGASCLPRESPFCRICHEGGSQEDLLSPCECIGTLGSLHQTCLEHWFAASNTSFCELCHFQFVVERKPQPFTKWLQNPNPKRERRTLLSDILCFIFITPLAGISGWLCLRGALDHLMAKPHNQLEAAGLIGLTVALLAIYVFWTAVSLRYHICLYQEWRKTHHQVKLLTACQGSRAMHNPLLSSRATKQLAETVV